MIWKDVESSQISQVGFDADSETLGIRFKAGTRSPASEYHYDSVPPRVHRALMAAESVGSYFTQEIKKRPELYPYTKIGDVLPPAPEVTESALAKVDKMTPEQIFVPGTMDPILDAIKDEVDRQAAKLDISTEANRKSLAALAFKVTKSKTFIENQRKSLVASEKKRLQTIDAEGRRIWDILEGIAADVRKPLTAWEQKDKDRIARHEHVISRLQEWPKIPYGASAYDIRLLIANAEDIDPSKAEEFASITTFHKNNAIKELTAALGVAEEVEKQKAENERLRAEATERAVEEREKAAARYAKEQAELRAAEDHQRLAREAQEAEARAKAAEANAIAEKEASERRAAEAVVAEKRRVAEELYREYHAKLARENDKKHRDAINRQAEEALAAAGISMTQASVVVQLIAEGVIPHVKIEY